MARRICAAVFAAALAVSFAVPASAAAPPGRSGDHAPLYYLALGDSLAAGYQPTGDPANMHRTNEGYADQLLAIAQESIPNLRLVNLSCPGEKSSTMRLGGGPCTYENGSQLADALAFLHAHGKFVAFITIDIGFNDFTCQTGLECIPPGVASVMANLPVILAELRAAAGPDTPIVGMNVYDPFLGRWFEGSAGQAFAQLSVGAVVQVNDVLEGLYALAGSPVADVETAFSTTDFITQVTLPVLGTVPLNVARICQWTWVCAGLQPPDFHANRDGYGVIAAAFATELGL